MSESVDDNLLALVLTLEGLFPPFEKELLSHVMTTLEGQSYDLLACHSVFICQVFIVLVLILNLIRELPDFIHSMTDPLHCSVLYPNQKPLSLYLSAAHPPLVSAFLLV